MTVTRDFYLNRADEAAAAAAASPLQNVRDRELRSEAAWRAMADRVLRLEEQRVLADRVRQDRISQGH
jgi:hypothetical protein